MKKITNQEMSVLIDKWAENNRSIKEDLYYCFDADANVWVGCDNIGYRCWVEEFNTEDDVVGWLDGKYVQNVQGIWLNDFNISEGEEYMNKQYFEDLCMDKTWEGLTNTQKRMAYAYNRAKNYECDWIGFESISDIDAVELVQIMKETNLHEVYITEDWSNQFETWYAWQKAGLQMLGVREIEAFRHVHDIKRYGESHNNPTMLVLVFKLKEVL